MRLDYKQEKVLMIVQEFIQNQLYNPYNYEFSVGISDIEEYPTFEISTEKWSMDFDPHKKRLCFNGDGIDSREFDQIKEIRDNGDTILSIFNREMKR